MVNLRFLINLFFPIYIFTKRTGFYLELAIPARKHKHLLLLHEVLGSNPYPIKPLTRCQSLATVATLMCGYWRKAA